ncbi:hypothetical protein BU16DRAFT_555802 [Lophium mytilinum]|uniref:Uncharacterized protein n=1 Tax=Lophium mytilinum TaxID=390894 RepID=A0A6A6R9I7_9PEZI|nr:hypothetical protein BU16DRAFT_555802 [Lophium mytilinum]
MVNFADILAFCYGQALSPASSPGVEEDLRRKAQWDQLTRYARDIYYHLPIQVTASLYHHVSCILLAIHNPALHQEPPSSSTVLRLRTAARALHDLDTTVREHVRALCGVALCNSWLAPAMTMTSTALTMCGEHFCDVERGEQNGMMKLLVKNEEKHGWPTGTA